MSTDNSASSQESGELNTDEAAEAFNKIFEGGDEPPVEVDTEVDPPKKEEEAEEEVEPPEGVEEGDDAPITIQVDGKPVTLTQAQLADAYKNGLRQSDYTQKTMAVAEQRKAAEAETQKAQQERYTYAQNLTKMAAQLEGAIQQQEKIDWSALLNADPIEYLKQQADLSKRQTALQENQREQSRIAQQFQAEQTEANRTHLATQQQEILVKLPQWKDEATASKERDAIKADLVKRGYTPEEISGISDHKAVVLAREAMLYRQMMAKANIAAKKMQTTPERVIRSGVASEGNPGRADRNAAMRDLAKSGSTEDAARVFATLL
jgi:hypothetical protein